MGVSGRPVDEATLKTIKRLAGQGVSRRKIMRVAGVARGTVDKYAKSKRVA